MNDGSAGLICRLLHRAHAHASRAGRTRAQRPLASRSFAPNAKVWELRGVCARKADAAQPSPRFRTVECGLMDLDQVAEALPAITVRPPRTAAASTSDDSSSSIFKTSPKLHLGSQPRSLDARAGEQTWPPTRGSSTRGARNPRPAQAWGHGARGQVLIFYSSSPQGPRAGGGQARSASPGVRAGLVRTTTTAS